MNVMPQPTIAVACADDPAVEGDPASPLEYGQKSLAAALRGSMTRPCVRVTTVGDGAAGAVLSRASLSVGALPESYVIVASGNGTWVIGRDQTGAMYGALDLTERLQMDGPGALAPQSPIIASPATQVRAANLFLLLPQPDEKVWWFQDPDFWRQYLDMMVRARLDFLDLHAMYNARNTVFPNALLYFAHSRSVPQVGVSETERLRNVQMLRTVVAMATARGIKVGLMSYRADTSLTGDREDWPLDDATLKQYTREAVADLVTQVPGLSRMGFRIGESLRPPSWYADTFVAGLHDSGTGVKPYTRTWQIPKANLIGLIQSTGDDYYLEAKLNGEQLGAPYAIAGGALAQHGWDVYSYQDYLEPPAPYTFIFQVRSCSTHRIFRYSSFERTRRAVPSFTLGTAKGFSLEAPHAFYPQRDFYHRPEDVFSPWTFRRDELMYLMFGRLSYDPATPEKVFRRALAERAGSDALWDAMQAAGDIVPWIQTANTCGPDTRDYAPDLEWGGTVAQWAQPPGPIPGLCNFRGPFDTFAVASPYETAADLIAGRTTTRLTPMEVARIVLDDAARARALADGATVDAANPEARDIQREVHALASLGEYFGHKLRAAAALAVFASTGSADYVDAAIAETQTADTAFQDLAADTAYISPFQELLRMNNIGLGDFHWRRELPLLAQDPQSIDAVAAQVVKMPPAWKGSLPPAERFLDAPRPALPASLSSLSINPRDPAAPSWTVTAAFDHPLPPGAQVKILWKKFTGFADWQSLPATGNGQTFRATIAGGGHGGMFAVEITLAGNGWRLPDATRTTPYFVLAPSE